MNIVIMTGRLATALECRTTANENSDVVMERSIMIIVSLSESSISILVTGKRMQNQKKTWKHLMRF